MIRDLLIGLALAVIVAGPAISTYGLAAGAAICIIACVGGVVASDAVFNRERQ